MCYFVYYLTLYFLVFAITERIEQQYCIKFCVALDDSEAKTIQKKFYECCPYLRMTILKGGTSIFDARIKC